MAVQMEKAKIQVLRKNKAEEVIPVMFNPSEYKISKSVNYSESDVQGKEIKTTIYKNGNPATLNVQLFFDYDIRYSSDGEKSSKDKRDVRKYTERILALLKPEKDTKKGLPHPPKCKFTWGTFSFYGYVSSANQSFTRFTNEGVPVRATVDITFTEIPDSTENNKDKKDIEKQYGAIKVNWQEELCTQTKSPENWRKIAEGAGILNPRTDGKNNRPNSVSNISLAKAAKDKKNTAIIVNKNKKK